MYRIVSPSRTSKPSSLTHSPYGRGQGEGRVTARDEKIPLGSARVKFRLRSTYSPRTAWEFAKLPFCFRKTALLAASIKLPDKPLPSSLRDDTVSPAGSVGAERCPLGTCAPIGGGKSRLPPWGSCHDFIVTEGGAPLPFFPFPYSLLLIPCPFLLPSGKILHFMLYYR